MLKHMEKGWMEYQAYIFDMDGTLYHQTGVRLAMARQMIWHYLRHIKGWREAFLLRDYRRLREEPAILEKPDFEEQIRGKLAERYGYTREKVELVIRDWMFERPLRILAGYRDDRLADWISELREQGKRVCIYSDYPAAGKVQALHLTVDGCFSPDGEHIRFLKPDASGLNYILKELKVPKENVLYIGDLYEKDGLCAMAAGVDYWILPKRKRERSRQYKEMNL